MITLHIAKLLEENGYGTLALTGSETGNNLIFFEKLPIGKNGIFLMSNGNTLSRNQRKALNFDIYARGSNDVNGAKRLEDILKFFEKECYPTCSLPTVPGYSENQYTNCTIVPTLNISNVGLDASDRVIYLASATITYKEN